MKFLKLLNSLSSKKFRAVAKNALMPTAEGGKFFEFLALALMISLKSPK